MKKGILFLLCLGGGVLFGGMFFVLFGIDAGYSWVLAAICMGGGLVFALAFFVIWLIVQKFSKPITFENLSAQKKLQENEKLFGAYQARFHARVPIGKGLKSAVCETYLYLLADKLRICYYYFRKIHTLEVDYGDLRARIDEEGFLLFQWQECGLYGRLVDEDALSLCNQLEAKGVLLQKKSVSDNDDNVDP